MITVDVPDVIDSLLGLGFCQPDMFQQIFLGEFDVGLLLIGKNN